MRSNFGFFCSQNLEMKHFSGAPINTDSYSVSMWKAQPCWRWKMGSRKDFFQLKKSVVVITQTQFHQERWTLRGKNPPKKLKSEKGTLKHRPDIPKALQNLISMRFLTHLEWKKWRITEEQKPCTVFCTWKHPPSLRSWAPPGPSAHN